MNIQSRQWFLIYASVSALALLAGCSGEERPGSSVAGGRRAPILNEEMMSGSPAAAAAARGDAPPEATLAAKNAKIAAQDDPFDAYDASGNKKPTASADAAPARPRAAAPRPEGENEEGFLDGIFGGGNETKSPAERPVRKPISGNVYAQGAAPAAPAPVVAPPPPANLPPLSSKDRIVDNGPHMLQLPKPAAAQPVPTPQLAPQVQAPAPAPEQPAVAAAPAQPVAKPKPADAEGNPGVLSHVAEYVTSKPDPQEAKEDAQTKYIPLSAVPQKPARLEEIKKESPQKLQDMQNANADAQQQKQALDSEATEGAAPDDTQAVEEQTKQVVVPIAQVSAPMPTVPAAPADAAPAAPAAAPAAAAVAARNLPPSDILKK